NRFRRGLSRPDGSSWKTAAAYVKQTQKSRNAPTAMRADMNGTFSHAALFGTGVRTHAYSSLRPPNRIAKSSSDTGRNPAVVSASRFTIGDHRASVSSIIPAMAGPVTARPDQKSRLTRYIDQTCAESAEVTPSANET